MSAATANRNRTVLANLMDEERLRQIKMMGKSGLAFLLAAVRRMLHMVLTPFRVVARMVFSRGNGEASGAPAVPGGGLPAGGVPGGVPGVDTANDFADLPGESAAESSPERLAAEVEHTPGGRLAAELTGPEDEIAQVLPILQQQMEVLLKAHLPDDASRQDVENRVTALAEVAERNRFKHAFVERQIESLLDSLVGGGNYAGMSREAVRQLVKEGGKTAQGKALFAEGSAEEKLIARYNYSATLAAGYSMSVAEIAATLVRFAGNADQGPTDQAPLVSAVLAAGDNAARSLQAGSAADLTSRLDRLPVALQTAMAFEQARREHARAMAEKVQEEAASAAALAAAAVAEEGAAAPVDASEPAVAAAPEQASPADAVDVLAMQASEPAAAEKADTIPLQKDVAPAAPAAAAATAQPTAPSAGGMFGGGMFGGAGAHTAPPEELFIDDEVALVGEDFGES